MPRRRMIDPFFYTDPKVGKMSRDERSLILGCISQADDEGRIQGDPAFLKSQIFKYDKDLDDTAVQQLRDTCLEKMKSWPATHPYRLILYSNSGDDYIFFPNWGATNRPSHPTKSQLPPPPPELLPIFSGAKPEELPTPAGGSPSQSRLGQSSLGQSRLGKGSSGEVREDFTKFLDSEKDLTDFLTTTLERYLPRGALWMLEVLKEFWYQAVGKPMDGPVYELTLGAVRKHPPPVLARAFVKAAKYKGGKYDSRKYLAKILEEQAGRK